MAERERHLLARLKHLRRRHSWIFDTERPFINCSGESFATTASRTRTLPAPHNRTMLAMTACQAVPVPVPLAVTVSMSVAVSLAPGSRSIASVTNLIKL